MGRGTPIAALALLMLTGEASAHRLAPLPCPPHGVDLIASDSEVRAYQPSAKSSVTACLVGHRTRMTLLPPPPPRPLPGRRLPPSLEKIVLAGPIAAYVVGGRTGIDTSSSTLVVADIASRRILRTTSAGRGAGPLWELRLTSLVVTSSGSVAWIIQQLRNGATVEAAVFAAPPIGNAILLDKSPEIAPESLTLADGVLGWSDGGTERTAKMP